MDATSATVLVVDDDEDVREALGRLLRSAGLNVATFASAHAFMAAPAFTDIGCLVLDVNMPDMSGPELHAWMLANDISLPVIFLSGDIDVPTSVQAMKRGARDVLEKPVDDEALLHAVAEAVERCRVERLHRDADDGVALRLASLSPREREVMDLVITGRLNKQIASDLGIVEKTVKVHRGRMMAKMRVRSVAELVHLCHQVGIPS